MENWQKNQPTTKKGDVGEEIIRDWLKKQGFNSIYEPTSNCPNLFDKIAIKDMSTIIAFDVKTKARLNKYNATGFTLEHWNNYVYASNKYSMPVFIFFVDEMEKKIYGQWISRLKERYYDFEERIEYPSLSFKENTIIFSLKKMKHIADLTEEQVKELKDKTNRNYDYKN